MYNRFFFFLIVLFALTPSQTRGWDDIETHPAFTEEAVDRAKDFKDALTSQLGFEGEIREKLYNGKSTHSIIKWLQDGSEKEDNPMCRAASHFHDPWKPWEESKLTDPAWYVNLYCWTKPLRGRQTPYIHLCGEYLVAAYIFCNNSITAMQVHCHYPIITQRRLQ
ncbi:MAG: hypothetical protein QTN59_00575 [Candidatus Electrothrix communis]|nr:MAG: hypothetical protein QTN59_00575 [Candidatus Electrothrix communis]